MIMVYDVGMTNEPREIMQTYRDQKMRMRNNYGEQEVEKAIDLFFKE